ncbi:MAG: HipA domain-containing protein [Ignavibacteria bacterium]
MNRCLYCYQLLNKKETDFHSACSRKFFNKSVPPELLYNEMQMEDLAQKVIKSHKTVTGVQPKLSLDITKSKNSEGKQRFTIVGLWGSYILKPPTAKFPQLPEIEDLTMHLANIAKIKVVPHSLIKLQSGNLAYITKRIDRSKKGKLPMEDMCQITERLTEHKYQGSYEQIAKAIKNFSTNPGLDVVNFFEQVLFSFLTGNSDMHLKNFSLINNDIVGNTLSPAYDMVATQLVMPEDKEDLALTLNGKKRKLKRDDFNIAFSNSNLETKQIENIFKKMESVKQNWKEFIDISFISDELKTAYKKLIEDRFERLNN